MNILQLLQEELAEEFRVTQKFFKLYPTGKNDYAPHKKSMKLMHLCTHLADVFGWFGIMLNTRELDVATAATPPKMETGAELMSYMEQKYQESISAFEKADERNLQGNWKLAHGDHTIYEWTKYGAMRHSLNQITHHRAQLGVYYRLLGIDVLASYGPTADDESFG